MNDPEREARRNRSQRRPCDAPLRAERGPHPSLPPKRCAPPLVSAADPSAAHSCPKLCRIPACLSASLPVHTAAARGRRLLLSLTEERLAHAAERTAYAYGVYVYLGVSSGRAHVRAHVQGPRVSHGSPVSHERVCAPTRHLRILNRYNTPAWPRTRQYAPTLLAHSPSPSLYTYAHASCLSLYMYVQITLYIYIRSPLSLSLFIYIYIYIYILLLFIHILLLCIHILLLYIYILLL